MMQVAVKSAGDIIKERRKRKGWSQTVLGDMVGMSAATIHRIEHGEKIPTDDEAAMIAGMLGISHEQLIEACSADRERFTDQAQILPKSAYQTAWDTAHPASYSGKVWIQVTPAPETAHLPHDYTLRWGNWQRVGTLYFDQQETLYLKHYKHNDGEGLPLFMTLSHPCYVVFGKGNPPENVPTSDINSKWRRSEPLPPAQLWALIKDYAGFYLRRLFGRS